MPRFVLNYLEDNYFWMGVAMGSIISGALTCGVILLFVW